MSKPLCFVLQLAGLGFIIFGIGLQYGVFHIVFGLALVVIGGVGFRKRIKR